VDVLFAVMAGSLGNKIGSGSIKGITYPVHTELRGLARGFSKGGMRKLT
jgi:hypothetical protein